MAINYNEQAALVVDRGFLGRVRQALANAALNIQTEADATLHHAERTVYAFKVLQDTEGYALKMAPGILADGSDYSGDTALDSRVSGIWNSYSMVDP